MSSHLLSNKLLLSHNKRRPNYYSSSHVSAAHLELDHGFDRVRAPEFASPKFEKITERTRKLIHKPEISISPYDTAWVAMVPSPNSSLEVRIPCFPDCLNWLLQNQSPDGSWSQPHHHSLLQKDVISSTLASILALRTWNLADDQVHKGIHYIESNFASITAKDQISPMGFDIIFTGMLEYAKDLSLDLNLEPKLLNDLICSRYLQLERWCEGPSMDIKLEAYASYLSEGIGKLQDWNLVMTKYQRKNGSLFNSPSTTAAACIFHHNNNACIDYLHSALKMLGCGAVPAIYPLNTYTQLCTVDNLERLGISRHFKKDIQSVLDETYRCWLQGDEEIVMDDSTLALAFRTLRENGYHVSSDQINKLLEDCDSNLPGGSSRDIHRTLELYKASEIFLADETDLEKHNLSLKHALEQELSNGSGPSGYSSELGRNIGEEVEHALQHPPHAIMDLVANRRNIKHYTSGNTRILKSSICSPNFGNKNFLPLAVADFNRSQKIHQEELRELERKRRMSKIRKQSNCLLVRL